VKYVQQCIPELRLVNKAKEEGVSLNTLVITMLSESLAHARTHGKHVKHHSAHKKNKVQKR